MSSKGFCICPKAVRGKRKGARVCRDPHYGETGDFFCGAERALSKLLDDALEASAPEDAVVAGFEHDAVVFMRLAAQVPTIAVTVLAPAKREKGPTA